MGKAETPSTRERKTFCRLCTTHCGMIVTVDENEQLVGIRSDPDDMLTKGFACYKGLQAVDAHNSQIRIRHPMKRMEDGSFHEIELEQALDEIAEKMKDIIAREGPEALGAYRGSGASLNAAAGYLVDGLLHQLGSRKVFSPITIDQSAKQVTEDRMGTWMAGAYPPYTCDVVLLVGANPLVSLWLFKPHDPMHHIKDLVANGLKILSIDPRRTETGRFAHMQIHPLPGEDAAILAGMIRLIFEQGWEDTDFLAENAMQVAELREAVAPFTPEYVAERADIDVDDFVEMTRTFASAKRGHVRTGTGGNMGRHSNLVEQMAMCLNAVCGFFRREGEEIPNPGVLQEWTPKLAQVRPPARPWDKGFKSRIRGYGLICGEMPTGIMADEILEPGPGGIKGFFCHGGNAAVIVPDQAKVIRAFRQLELLVTIDVHWNPTCELSHYVLPTAMQYERPDLPLWLGEAVFYDYVPFTRYTRAVAKPPLGSNVTSDVYIFWSLAKRLGIQMLSLGKEVDMSKPPESDDLLRIAARHAPLPFEELQSHEMGVIIDFEEPVHVQAGNPGPEDRFHMCPPDVFAEMRELAAEPMLDRICVASGKMATHRFTVRRHRDMWNSTQRGLESIRKRIPHNVACLHPDDLEEMDVRSGELVRITSEIASVDVVSKADETVRRGAVTMVHGFGVLPERTDPFEHGASANLLISTRPDDIETINAMPRMTSFAVHVGKAGNRPPNERHFAAGDVAD